MKTLEHDLRLPAWLDELLNSWPWALDADGMRSVAFAVDREGFYMPETRSLFYNGFVMARFNWPFGAFLHVKVWPTWRVQAGLGWKLNGRFGILLRAQTDSAAAKGDQGPNWNQAAGFDRGTA